MTNNKNSPLRLILLVITIIGCSIQSAAAQCIKIVKGDTTWIIDTLEYKASPYKLYDVEAVYPGGDKALIAYISKKVHLPRNWQIVTAKPQKTLSIAYHITASGSITDSWLLTPGVNDKIDSQIMTILNKSKGWKPAILKGIPVKSVGVTSIGFDTR